MSHLTSGSRVITIAAAVANTTVSIPAGHAIVKVFIENTTANAVTGGVRVGTTDTGVDVVVAVAVGANAIINITDAALLKSYFSSSAATTLYVQAVAAWNSASLNVSFLVTKLIA